MSDGRAELMARVLIALFGHEAKTSAAELKKAAIMAGRGAEAAAWWRAERALDRLEAARSVLGRIRHRLGTSRPRTRPN